LTVYLEGFNTGSPIHPCIYISYGFHEQAGALRLAFEWCFRSLEITMKPTITIFSRWPMMSSKQTRKFKHRAASASIWFENWGSWVLIWKLGCHGS